MTSLIVVEHADDPRLLPYRHLPSRRSWDRRFVAETEVAVLRLLNSTLPVESVLLTEGRLERLLPHIPADTLVLVAAPQLIKEVVGFDMHRGCAATGLRPQHVSWPLAARRVVVAEGLADPANFGALVRNCKAFGVDLVIADPKGADPWSRKSIRASMGHVFTMPVLVHDPTQAVQRLRQSGFQIWAATVDATAVAVDSITVIEPLALLVGNEGYGLSESLRCLANGAVTIPIAPEADSLNVAAATAVILYTLRRS